MSGTGAVDYWCNAFFPDREQLWDAAVADQDIQVKVRRDPNDAFATPEAMVARMNDVGIGTLMLPTGDLPTHAGVRDYETFASRVEEVGPLVDRWPGRFVAVWSIDPGHGIAGVRRAAAMLRHEWVVGLHTHTHSWDRPLDHADYYPYYTLAAEHHVPFIMQAGTSGGLMPSECGRPITIDRPAIYFPDTAFVLSHTGWPWCEEAIAMALKFPNVYLGTAAYPPRHWAPSIVDFIARAGRRKVIWGTGFPVVGHRHSLSQLGDLKLVDSVRDALLGGNARAIFNRLP
jgi:predicted TIM-barrel fold metal-dependent hydrolase